MRMFNGCAFVIVALGLLPITASAQSLVTGTRNVETEFLWSQSDADAKCPRVAAEAGGTWTGDWRISVPGKSSFCQIKPGSPPASQPASSSRNIEVGPIWSQLDAEDKCPRAAAEARTKWTGQWRTTVPGQMSVCEVIDPAPVRTQLVEAGPIWSQADAVVKCPVAAVAVRGRWTGQWSTTVQGQMSVCEMADMPPPRLRNVEAGPVWDQADANTKCPVAAAAVHGRWTGQWSTTRQGQMSVCEIAD